MQEGLKAYLDDNTQSWEMQPDGTFKRNKRGRSKARCAQRELLAALATG
jgi:polyphosphate kinase